MKPFKVVEPKKLVAWSLVVMFSFLQIVPTGWAAARPAEELQTRGVPASVDALAKPVKAVEPVASMQRVPTFVDSTAFQLNENPLSPATKAASNVIPKSEAPTVMPKSEDPGLIVRKEASEVLPPATSTVPPRETHIVTNPETGKELSVTINDRNIATVKWGDQEYKGYFDAATNSVHVITNDDSIWTLQFAATEDGSLYLQSFHSSFWSFESSADETYTFDVQGQLVRKDWNKTDSIYTVIDCLCVEGASCDCPQGGASTSSYGGTIDYVAINGKTLVSHEKSWSESSGMIWRWGGWTDSETWYSYDVQGNLAAKSWENKNDFGSSYGQETYVQINGKTFLSSSKVWQYNEVKRGYAIEPIFWVETRLDGNSEKDARFFEGLTEIDIVSRIFMYVSSHTETFYTYDAEGNLVSELSATEGYDYNNVRHTSGMLWTRDAAKNTWSLIAAEGIDPFKVWFRQDASEIKALAQRMTVYVGGNVERYSSTHRVEYTRNADGSMTAKAVYDNAGNVSVVQGEPDVLSGETNDITFQNGQQVGGYYVSYQEYWRDGVSEGYRLVFYDSNWNATAVDFPAQNTVVLNGIENKITIDPNGNILLEATIPPAVQEYIDALKAQLGEWFKVKAILQKNGTYLVRVAAVLPPCAEAGTCQLMLLAGAFSSVEYSLSAEGVLDRNSVSVVYNGIEVDGKFLLEAMGALEASFHPEGADWMVAPPYYYARLVTLMTEIVVTESGSDHLRFDHNGTSYKAYRDAEGEVILEKEQTREEKAIAAVKADLVKTLGLDLKQLESLIESISFENGAVSVIFEIGAMGDSRLIDMIGSNKLPNRVIYEFDDQQVVRSARLEWDEKDSQSGLTKILVAHAGYLNGLIRGVSWTRQTSSTVTICGEDGTCSEKPVIMSEFLHRDVYVSHSDGTILIQRFPFIRIICLEGSSCQMTPQREILLKLMEDGKYHVSEVRQFENGALKDVSNFVYVMTMVDVLCVAGEYCPPVPPIVSLARIVRMDAEGNMISKISLRESNALITLSNGASKEVGFSTFEELLDQARQFEGHVAAMISAVKADLVKTLGLSAEALDALIESIVFADGAVKVAFVSGAMGDSRLINVLGSNSLPFSAVYAFGEDGKLMSSTLHWAESEAATLHAWISYDGEGRISGVVWTRVHDSALPEVGIELLGNDGYAYGEGSVTISRYSAAVAVNDPTNGLQRETLLKLMEDGKYYVEEVRQYANGQLVDASKFLYLVGMTAGICTPEGKCPPPVYDVRLANIVRTDANGKALSEVVINGNNALITLPDGQTKEAVFLTLEELIDEARAFEAATVIPPAVQEYIDALKAKLGEGFKVKAILQKNGTYLVRVAAVLPPCAEAGTCELMLLAGAFSSVEYSLSADGVLNRDSVKASYNGIEVDGKFLLEAMGALEASFHPEGTDWMPAPAYYYARLVTLMTQIVVKEAGADLLRFDHQGTSYKAYRAASGEVVVSKEIVKPNIPGLPDNELAAYISDVAAHFGIRVEDIVSIEKYEAMNVCLGTGCPAWALDVELTAMLNGKKTILKGAVEGPAWDVPVKLDPVPASISGTVTQSDAIRQEDNADYVEPLSFPTVSAPEVFELVQKVQSLAIAGSLGLVSNLSEAVDVAADSEAASAIFGFEQGSILFSKLLKALTK